MKVFTILTTPNLVFQFNSITYFMELKREKTHQKFWLSLLERQKPCYKVYIINNFQRQSCSPKFLEENCIKYFKIGKYLQL